MDEHVGPELVHESVRRTLAAHEHGKRCMHCPEVEPCRQLAWARQQWALMRAARAARQRSI